jgi:imidazolonepropionase
MTTQATDCDLLLTNCNLFTADPQQLTIENAAIAIKEHTIVWFGKQSELPEQFATPKQALIELDNGWLLPGLIDCHTHMVYAGNRANEFELRQQGVSYQDIAKSGGGILATVKATRAASFEQLLESSLDRIQNWLNEGVTSIEIKSGYGLDLTSELTMLKVAKALSEQMPIDVYKTLLAAHALPPEFDDKDAYIDHIIDQILPAAIEQNLVDAVDGFCESIGFSTEQIERLFKAAQQNNLKIKLHAEQLSNLQGAKLCANYQGLSADHLEHLDQASIEAMHQAGTVAVLLPGAFYFLKDTKLPPIEALRQAKVPMALATDCNPGSSPCFSLLLMLNMGCTLFGLTIEEALMGVTINAAKALGIEQQVGSISIGKQADLSYYQVEQVSELAYLFGSNPCQMVFKAGQRVMG